MSEEFPLHCPQCGNSTERLCEGYCDTCCQENQDRLDAHNAEWDRWNALTDQQREAEIKVAMDQMFGRLLSPGEDS